MMLRLLIIPQKCRPNDQTLDGWEDLLLIHFVLVARHQQTPPLTTNYVISSLWPVAAECVGLSVPSTRWNQISTWFHRVLWMLSIAISAYFTCLRRLLRKNQNGVRRGYPIVKKCWRYVYSFRQNPLTWRQDRLTGGHRPRLHSITRQ